MDGLSGFPGHEAIDLTPPVCLEEDDFVWPDCPAPPPPPSPPPLPVPVLRTGDPNALEGKFYFYTALIIGNLPVFLLLLYSIIALACQPLKFALLCYCYLGIYF
jgi:hypothetical protein